MAIRKSESKEIIVKQLEMSLISDGIQSKIKSIKKRYVLILGEGEDTYKIAAYIHHTKSTGEFSSMIYHGKSIDDLYIDDKDVVREPIRESLEIFDKMVKESEVLLINAYIPSNEDDADERESIFSRDSKLSMRLKPKDSGFIITNRPLEASFLVPIDVIITNPLKHLIIELEKDKPLDGVTRIDGYHSSIMNWNKSKIGKLHNRQMAKNHEDYLKLITKQPNREMKIHPKNKGFTWYLHDILITNRIIECLKMLRNYLVGHEFVDMLEKYNGILIISTNAKIDNIPEYFKKEFEIIPTLFETEKQVRQDTPVSTPQDTPERQDLKFTYNKQSRTLTFNGNNGKGMKLSKKRAKLFELLKKPRNIRFILKKLYSEHIERNEKVIDNKSGPFYSFASKFNKGWRNHFKLNEKLELTKCEDEIVSIVPKIDWK